MLDLLVRTSGSLFALVSEDDNCVGDKSGSMY